MVTITDEPLKGRAATADRDYQAGEAIVHERPVFLIVDEPYIGRACCVCLKLVHQGQGERCECQAAFCCQRCKEQGVSSPFWHPTFVCQALRRLDRHGLSTEDACSLRFLVHVKAAKAATAFLPGDANGWSAAQLASCHTFWNLLEGLTPGAEPHPGALELHRRLSQATGGEAGLSVHDVDQILRKEASNSYGIMAASGPEGARNIRGSGLYPLASLLNHDCLPNTARFDAFDAPTPLGIPADTRIELRALHDLPAGEELTASYFPLTTGFRERQRRCRHVYGFECRCPRCQVESTWSDDEESGSGDEMKDAEIGAPPAGPSAAIDESYIQVFLLKYVCPQEHCLGTLAPILGSDRYECNMCGFARSEADFLRELQEY